MTKEIREKSEVMGKRYFKNKEVVCSTEYYLEIKRKRWQNMCWIYWPGEPGCIFWEQISQKEMESRVRGRV